MANTRFNFTPVHLTPVTCGEFFGISPFTHSLGEGSLVSFASGQKIFGSEIAASSIWILVSGTATVSFCTSSGHNVSRSAHRNEVFGLTEMLARIPYCVTLEAGANCRFRKLSESDVRSRLVAEKVIRARLLRELSARYLAVHKLLSQKILL
jgi:CRP-like cAMP-binding protein